MIPELKEVWEQFKKWRSYPYIRTAVRTGLIYLIYAFMASVILFQLEWAFVGDAGEYFDLKKTLSIVTNITALILSFLILNTVLLTFSMFSKSERIAFLENRSDEYDKKAERKKLLRSPTFLTETAMLIFFLFTLPCTDSIESLLTLWLGKDVIHPILIRLIHTFLFGIAAFAINLYGHMDARDYWLELPARLAKGTIWKSMSVKKKQSYSYFRMILRLIGYFLIYLIAAKLLPVILMTFASVFELMIFLLASVGVLAVIGLIFSTNYLGALLKRRSFLKKLKNLCKQNGFSIHEIKHPYLSVFRETDGYTFALSAHGETYYARIISCINRGNYMIFDEKGIFSRVKLFRIPLPRLAAARGYVHSFDRGTGEDRELFRITSEVNYTFEADGKKLLILNPPARFVKISHGGSLKDADNGDHVRDYSIYASNAFLRALDRNAIQ
ncbi:MAG: hypothetical protein IKC59_07545 [Clostridia bacterium]|nr:hypothetical protein [Clostridia bacterium]